jgi:hypothetical protein
VTVQEDVVATHVMSGLPNAFSSALATKGCANDIRDTEGSFVNQSREVVLKDGGLGRATDTWQGSDSRPKATAFSKGAWGVVREGVAGKLDGACPKDGTKCHPVVGVIPKGRKPRQDVGTVTVWVRSILDKHLFVETGTIKHLLVAQVRLEHLSPNDNIGSAVFRVSRAIGT